MINNLIKSLPDGAGSIGAGSQVSISWASISISKRSLSTPSLVGEGQSNAQVVNSGSLAEKKIKIFLY